MTVNNYVTYPCHTITCCKWISVFNEIWWCCMFLKHMTCHLSPVWMKLQAASLCNLVERQGEARMQNNMNIHICLSAQCCRTMLSWYYLTHQQLARYCFWAFVLCLFVTVKLYLLTALWENSDSFIVLKLSEWMCSTSEIMQSPLSGDGTLQWGTGWGLLCVCQ